MTGKLVMRCLRVPLGDRFCMSARRGEVGGCTQRVQTACMAMSGFSFRKALVVTGWAVLLCIIGFRKQSSHLVGSSFLALKFFQSGWATVGQEC